MLVIFILDSILLRTSHQNEILNLPLTRLIRRVQTGAATSSRFSRSGLLQAAPSRPEQQPAYRRHPDGGAAHRGPESVQKQHRDPGERQLPRPAADAGPGS